MKTEQIPPEKMEGFTFHKENTAFGFKLIAKSREEIVGIYELPFDKSREITHGYINSKLPHQQIPRNLINLATAEISKISSQEERRITHKEFLINPESFRLSPIFENLGYEKIEQPNCLILSRTYN